MFRVAEYHDRVSAEMAVAVAGGLAQGELAEQVAAAREVALSLVRWGAALGFEAAIEARRGCPAAAVSVLQSWSADATFTRELLFFSH